MAFTNDYVTWGTAAGANVDPPATYAAAVIRQQGAQYGIADPVTFNTMARQASMIATMIAQFTADYGTGNVIDDGNLVTLEAQYIAALIRLINLTVGPAAAPSLYLSGPDTGSANTYVFASPSPTITSLVPGLAILATVAHNNTAGSTANFAGLGAATMVRADGSALQANDLRTTGESLLYYNSSGQFVVMNILPTSTSVPVATTSANGIARQATLLEAQNATTTGSAPAFVTPEGLGPYSKAAWTTTDRSASGTETSINEYINILGSSTWSITLVTPVGHNGAGYVINNLSTANQNIITPAGQFISASDVGSSTTNITIPPNGAVWMASDGTNWVIQSPITASQNNRGIARLATNSEALNGATAGELPAVMTPENMSAFFYAQVATTSVRGISRQATNTEMTNAVTTGSTPAFVTPEGLALFNPIRIFNPFVTTGVGSAIIMSATNAGAPAAGGFCSLQYNGSSGTVSAVSFPTASQFFCRDNRWTSNPAGTWQLAVVIDSLGLLTSTAGTPIIGIFVRTS